MLDVARHPFTEENVKSFIDMMALHNLNTFHWHITDDQGWRIEIEKYPLLTAVGSRRDSTVIGHNSGVYDNKPVGGYFTKEQARDIVEYAARHHITVIPEIDLPGHMLCSTCLPQSRLYRRAIRCMGPMGSVARRAVCAEMTLPLHLSTTCLMK